MVNELEQYISHYGVPGMKWGKRKAVNLDLDIDSKEAEEIATLLGRGGTSDELSEEEQRKRLAEYYAKKQGLDLENLGEEALDNFMKFVDTTLKAINSNVGKFLDDTGKNVGDFLAKAITTKSTIKPISSKVDYVLGADGKPIAAPGKSKSESTISKAQRDLVRSLRESGALKTQSTRKNVSTTVKSVRGADGKLIETKDSKKTTKELLEKLKHANTDEDLAHYGVPGMRWGKRKARGSAVAPAAKIKSEDFIDSRQLKKKKVSELSNDELQRLTKRMDLEAKYSKINPSKIEKGQKIVKRIMGVADTANSVYKFMNSDVGKLIISRGTQSIKQQVKTAAK